MAASKFWRDEPRPFGPSPKRKVALVEINTLSRRPLMAWPRTRSDSPREYTFAVANIDTPASRQMSASRRASVASVLPHAARRPTPPKVPVPKLSAGTVRPDNPKRRYSIYILLVLIWLALSVIPWDRGL